MRKFVRRFLGIQKFLGNGEMENGNSLPEQENSADRMTTVESDVIPLLRLLGSGAFNPGILRMRGRSDDVELAKEIFLFRFRVNACPLFRQASSLLFFQWALFSLLLTPLFLLLLCLYSFFASFTLPLWCEF